MLKFKQIRKSIITHKEPCNNNEKSPTKVPFLRRNLFGETQPTLEMSFKTIKQSNISPLKKLDSNAQISTNKKNKFGFQDSAERHNLSPLSNKKRMAEIQKSKGMYIYDSDRKAINNRSIISNFGSEQKQNENNSIYITKQNNNISLQGANLNFTQKERKLNSTRQNFSDSNQKQCSNNTLYETTKVPTPGSLAKKNSCSMLFKTALETSNRKKTLRNNIDSDRSTTRQSSIGKLKQKLFGMKKIISQKQNRPQNQYQNIGQQTKSFTIYTRKQSTDGKCQALNPYNKSNSNGKQNQATTFSNLVVDSVQKNLFKGTYQNFFKVQEKKEIIFNKILMNQSRVDSVNMSMAESCESILDMSPNL